MEFYSDEEYPLIPIPEDRIGIPLINISDTVELVKDFLSRKKNEYLLSISLTRDRKPISIRIVAIGSREQATLSTIDIIRSAIIEGASGIILVHNHPGGKGTPSPKDFESTKIIEDAAESVFLKVVDSIIIGEDDYQSIPTEYKKKLGNEIMKPVKNNIVFLLFSIEQFGETMMSIGLIIIAVFVFILFTSASNGVPITPQIPQFGQMILVYPISWSVKTGSKFVRNVVYGDN